MDKKTEEERRERTTDIFASWALEGMYPSEKTLEDARRDSDD